MSDDFDQLLASVMAQASAEQQRVEAHRATCSVRPCDACRIWLCAGCGAETQCGPVEVGDRPHPARCESCAEQAERDQLVARAMATIPPAFAWASLASPDLPHRVPNIDRVRGKVELLASARRGAAVFFGESGAGKTSLAVCALRAVIDAGRAKGAKREEVEWARDAMFTSARKLALARSETKLGAGEAPLVERAMRASVLLVDDLGAEADAQKSALVDIVAERYDADRPTWVTTWLKGEELAERYGGGTRRRLTECGNVIRLAPRVARGAA